MIHQTAIIDKDAKIDSSVEIGPYCIIGKNVKINKNVVVGAFSIIESSEIDESCKISNNVCIGGTPQDFKYHDKPTKVFIGKNCTIREFTTIHRGSITDSTKIGDRSYLMAYSHIAHDCVIGNDVVMANCATLAGHVKIEEGAIIGGLVAIHQFCRIGKFSMLGGGAMVNMDVPPYATASGDRVRLYGLNLIGLKRRGYSIETIKNIKFAYRLLFRSKMNLSEALEKLESVHKKKNLGNEVAHIIEFIKTTKRGICRESYQVYK